jgi:hypothetical protein
MAYRKIAGCLGVAALSMLTGCCAWCDRYCSHPAYAPPAYAPPAQYGAPCAPCAPQPTCCPAGYQPATAQPNWSSPQPAYYPQQTYYPQSGCCQ